MDDFDSFIMNEQFADALLGIIGANIGTKFNDDDLLDFDPAYDVDSAKEIAHKYKMSVVVAHMTGTLTWKDVLLNDVLHAISCCGAGDDIDVLHETLRKVRDTADRWMSALDRRAEKDEV